MIVNALWCFNEIKVVFVWCLCCLMWNMWYKCLQNTSIDIIMKSVYVYTLTNCIVLHLAIGKCTYNVQQRYTNFNIIANINSNIRTYNIYFFKGKQCFISMSFQFSRIPVGLPRHVAFDNVFIILLVNMQYSGVLTCTAKNEFGSDTKSMHVIVQQCKLKIC